MGLRQHGDGASMSDHDFRVFQDRQPDGQRWELVEGTPIMMAPPKIMHQRISQNLARLIDDALDVHDPSLTAIERPGVSLGLGALTMAGSGKAATYVPEPDIAVIEASRDPDRRIVSAAVVLVEIVSSTDEIVTSDGRPWVDVKASLYRMHAPCQAVLVIEQERTQIRMWERGGGGWIETSLSNLGDVLQLRCCGLRCELGDVYAKTHLVQPDHPQPGVR